MNASARHGRKGPRQQPRPTKVCTNPGPTMSVGGEPPPPHARLHREYNGAKTRTTGKDTGKEEATQVRYMLHARPRTREEQRTKVTKDVRPHTKPRCKCKYVTYHTRPTRANNRDKQRCVTNQ